MATEQILTLLIAERDKLNQAIAALRGTSTSHTTQPAASHAASHTAAAATAPAEHQTATRKRKPLTAAQKKAHSERMKAFWAARRKKQAKG